MKFKFVSLVTKYMHAFRLTILLMEMSIHTLVVDIFAEDVSSKWYNYKQYPFCHLGIVSKTKLVMNTQANAVTHLHDHVKAICIKFRTLLEYEKGLSKISEIKSSKWSVTVFSWLNTVATVALV